VGLLHAPASLVVVWADGPALLHITLVPAFTEIDSGEKEKSLIVTTTFPCIDDVSPPPPPPELAPVGVELLPQATIAARPPSAMRCARCI
jgi:hypothetical protein